MPKTWFPVLISLIGLSTPAVAQAQFYGRHNHHGWDGAYSTGYGSPGYASSSYVRVGPFYTRSSYQSSSYGQPMSYLYPPTVAYIAPAPYIVQPVQPQIPLSTFRVDEVVSSCRLRDEDRIEVCDGFQLLDPRSFSDDRVLLRQVANLMRWGLGYSVVAHFTRHANGSVDVTASAVPIYLGYVPQSAFGQGSSTANALQDALSRLSANLVR